MAEEHVLMCFRVARCEPAVQSTVGSCDKCGAAIWVADSSPKNLITRCFACAALFMTPDAKLEPPTDKQLRDIGWLG
jgi:hypothetical protein